MVEFGITWYGMERDMRFGLVGQAKAWYVPARFGEVRNLGRGAARSGEVRCGMARILW